MSGNWRGKENVRGGGDEIETVEKNTSGLALFPLVSANQKSALVGRLVCE